MLPRARRPHDQLLKTSPGMVALAGIGGLILGHVLWLLGISIALGSTSVNGGVLIVSAFFLVTAGAAAYLGVQQYQQKRLVPAAFVGGLSISPLVFTLIVLGETYL